MSILYEINIVSRGSCYIKLYINLIISINFYNKISSFKTFLFSIKKIPNIILFYTYFLSKTFQIVSLRYL